MCETLLHSSGAAGTARAVLTGVWGCGSTPGSPGDKGGPGGPSLAVPLDRGTPGATGKGSRGAEGGAAHAEAKGIRRTSEAELVSPSKEGT